MAFFEAPILMKRPDLNDRHHRGESDTADGILRRAEMGLAKSVFDILQEAYPGHAWITQANGTAQLLMFRLGVLMDANRWFTLHADRLTSLPDLRKAVIRGGGELLERFGLGRGPIEVDSFLHARATKKLWSHHQRMPE